MWFASEDPPSVRAYLERLLGFAIPHPQRPDTAAIEAAGREAWHRLHSEPIGTPEWVADWMANYVPKGCGCGGSATTLLEQLPPRYDSPEEWFAWTVEFHNLVNRKLGKPEMTLEHALALWRP